MHRIGGDMQRLWRMEKDKDPTTLPFYHARLPVYSLLSGPVTSCYTSNMYQFDEHCMWIGTTSRWDKQVYLLLSPVLMPLCARGLAHCCLRYSSLFITFTVAELCDIFRWTFRRDAEQEPWWFHASDSRTWTNIFWTVGMLMRWLLWMTRLPWLQRLRCRTSRGGLKWRFWLCQRSSKRTL